MNNRKMTRGRKFTYVPRMVPTETKFGTVVVPDPKSKIKVPINVSEKQPIRGEGLVYDPNERKWVKREDMGHDTKREPGN